MAEGLVLKGGGGGGCLAMCSGNRNIHIFIIKSTNYIKNKAKRL